MYPSSWNSPADVVFVCRAQDNAAIKRLRSSKKNIYSSVQYSAVPTSKNTIITLILIISLLVESPEPKELDVDNWTRGGWWTSAVGWTWIYLEVIWQGLVRVRECTKLKTRFSWPLWTSSLPLFGTWWPVFFGAQQTFCFWAHRRRSHFPEEAPPFPLRLGKFIFWTNSS